MKFKSFLKINSFSFARNFKNTSMKQGDDLKMAEMLSQKVVQNLTNNRDKITQFLKKFPTEESYMKFIYANKFGLDVNKVKEVDYSKLTDKDLIAFGDSLFKDAFEDVIDKNFKGNPKMKGIEEVLGSKGGKNKKQLDKDFETKGEKVIDVQSEPEVKEEPEKNLKELMDEIDSSFNRKMEANMNEKDINKIQANIFKKEKVIKDKSNLNNNDGENKTQSKPFNRNNGRNIKF